MREGWELDAARLARRRVILFTPLLFGVAVIFYVLSAVRSAQPVRWTAIAVLLGLNAALCAMLIAVFWRRSQPGSRSSILSPVSLLPRAERRALIARMRTGEPAESFEQAKLQLAVAEGMCRQRWLPVVLLMPALARIPDVITGNGVGGRWLASVVVIGGVGLSVSSELNRRGALRSIDANQRRWGGR